MNIRQLQLFTSDLEAQKAFYTRNLGFDCLEERADSFAIKSGDSKLLFKYSPGKPYYHFAFNIPSFQCKAALAWLKKRVNILKDGSDEIIDFVNWNAEAVYFSDPAGNIVEFIARKNLNIQTGAAFSAQSILNISEIGLPVDDVCIAFHQLCHKTGARKYWGDYSLFCATGDEHGLFIIVGQNRKMWYPTEKPAKSFPLSLQIEQAGKSFWVSIEADGSLLIS